MTNTIILLAILLVVMALFYSLQKGLNQVISGLNAIDARLSKLDERKEKATV